MTKMNELTKTIWFDENSQPKKNWLWAKDGVIYKWDISKRKWVESDFKITESSNPNQGESESGGSNTPVTPTHDYSQDYLTFEILSDGTITWNEWYMMGPDENANKDIQYSKDNGQTWTEISSFLTGTINVQTGDTVLFKGNNDAYYVDRGMGYTFTSYFNSTCSFNVSGNIMSLIYGDNFQNKYSFPDNSTRNLNSLFKDCTGLMSAENLILPATTLEQACYINMFTSCANLTVAPQLPATTLAASCYSHMFNECTSLTVMPQLPATTLAPRCYDYMFNGCTDLVTALELPATILAENCYNYMFNGCTNLTTAPEISATTLAPYCCDNMFRDCVNLTTAPELPVVTLAERCYSHMFYGCTSLTTAPELPATTLVDYCYTAMFYECTSLNYIKCLAETDSEPDSATGYWVYEISPTGTFVKHANANHWSFGESGIPDGWTVENA